MYTYMDACLSVCDTMCMQYLQGQEEGVGSFVAGIIGGCVPPKKGAMFFITVPSLHWFLIFCLNEVPQEKR